MNNSEKYAFLLLMSLLFFSFISGVFVSFTLVKGNSDDTGRIGSMGKDTVSSYGYQPQYIKSGDNFIHFIEAGKQHTDNPKKQSIILLHGFPYFAQSWHKVIKPLSQYYHVLAPEHRGYGKSSKPKAPQNYHLEYLVEDISALISQKAANQPVVLIGHDWGGVLAWALAAKSPELIDKVVVINAPPLDAFLTALATSEQQQQASKYIASFSGWLAKLIFEIRGTELLWGESFQRMLSQGHIDQQFKQAFFEAWQNKDSVYAAINWYKVNIPEFDKIVPAQHQPSIKNTVNVKSLLIWSIDDKAFTQDTFSLIPNYVQQLTIKTIDTDSHTPYLDHTKLVLNSINKFLSAGTEHK